MTAPFLALVLAIACGPLFGFGCSFSDGIDREFALPGPTYFAILAVNSVVAGLECASYTTYFSLSSSSRPRRIISCACGGVAIGKGPSDNALAGTIPNSNKLLLTAMSSGRMLLALAK